MAHSLRSDIGKANQLGVTMESERAHDGLFSELNAKPTSPMLTETNPVLLQLLQRTELEALLQELDELIESEGGLLIP